MVLTELIFSSFLFWEGVVVLHELILTVSTFRGCGRSVRSRLPHPLKVETVKISSCKTTTPSQNRNC